ncbi:MAG: sigma-70 family RNA polymerase sigma factor [Lentisphaeraceae bacterium]|nr:sigma-70 family RNA polymerase sigma factor [Lentisphaeraceae bacterium]
MENDSDIIAKIKNGKSEAYRLLVRRYTQNVRFYLAKRLSDHHEIEDLTQDVFVAAYQSLGNYDPEKKNFNGWLHTIAHNKLMSHLRKHYATTKRDLVLESQILDQCDNTEPPEELIDKMKKCLSKLPESAQQLIKSRYFTTEPVMLLAERLGSSENAISSKLFRIRKNLKSCIEGDHD